MQNAYQSKLPHIQPIWGVFMLTWRLYGSLPSDVAIRIKAQRDATISKLDPHAPDANVQKYMAYRQQILDMEDYLDRTDNGPFWLNRPEVAQVVVDSLKKYDGQYYRLEAYTIMSNHVHVLLDLGIQDGEVSQLIDSKSYVQLSKVIQLIKGASARYGNLLLGRTGSFWEKEYFDRYIRNEKHFFAAKNYILMNPVKAKICDNWWEHPFTWRKESYEE